MNTDVKGETMYRYALVHSWNDYDCGAPGASLRRLCMTWEEAYDALVEAMLNDFEVAKLEDLGEKEYDYDLPPKSEVNGHTHKCATAWVNTDDGEQLYDIQPLADKVYGK